MTNPLTILVVDDGSAMPGMVATMQENFGYIVLSANNPQEALCLAKKSGNSIDFLVTDVIMPDMNGRDLADELVELHTDIKCPYISGYSENILSFQCILDKDVRLIQKPFSSIKLAVRRPGGNERPGRFFPIGCFLRAL